jgi:hypothetical protein
VPSRDGDKGNSLGVISDLLDESRNLLDDLSESRLRVLGGVHLVDSNNQLSNTEGVGKKSVLTGLSILGDTSLKLTSSTSNDKNGAIGLGLLDKRHTWEVPVIMFLMKSRCPGASMTVTYNLGVSNFQRAI